jgi:hypothetical protein
LSSIPEGEDDNVPQEDESMPLNLTFPPFSELHDMHYHKLRAARCLSGLRTRNVVSNGFSVMTDGRVSELFFCIFFF